MAKGKRVPYPEAVITPVLLSKAKSVRDKVCVSFQAKPFSNYPKLAGIDVEIGSEGGD